MSASAAASASPTLTVVSRYSEMLGHVDDPEAFFEAEKRRIHATIGDISGIRVTLNRIVVALYVRPKTRKLANGAEFEIPDVVRDEDKWQGVAGLVVAMGPHCYEDNDQIAFSDGDRCRVGDWVMLRRGEGFRTRLWNWECIIVEGERGIKMVLPRPDAVF